MRIPFALLLVVPVASCAEPYADGRLRPVAVPKIAEADPGAPRVGQPVPAQGPATGAAELPPVAVARVTEADVLEHVDKLQLQHGEAGLRALSPGTTLAERLRFCTARILLGKAAEVLPELQRLATAHASHPLIWRQLGYAHYWTDHPADAERCLRKAYALAAAAGFADNPSLPSFFGKFLLERQATAEEGVKVLRRELAEGQDYTRAAWALASHLVANERHTDALACLDAALTRDPEHAQLPVAKAKVLVELHQAEAAARLLEPLLQRPQPDRYAVETMLRVRILENRFADALPLIDQLLALPGLAEADRLALQERRESVAAAVKTGFRERVPAWKVEAIVRGHPNLQFRVKVLRQVMEQENVRLRERCLLISFGSSAPVQRAEALVLLIPHAVDPLSNLRAGLEDSAGSVRGTAAALAATLKSNRDQATVLLLEFLGKEQDAYAFGQIHAALVKLTGKEIDLPFGAAKDPEQRRAIAAKWRAGR